MHQKICSTGLNLPVIETNWSVISGCPSAGKSTTVEALKREGFTVVSEYSREYYGDLKDFFISSGLNINDIRAEANIAHNQEEIYRHRIEMARSLNPNHCIIFDTGIPESLVRLEMYAKEGLEISTQLITEAQIESERYRYHKIFHLEPLDLISDGIRIEDQEMVNKLNKLTREIYERLGYEVISVPRFSNDKEQSIVDRVEFIKSYM